MGEDVAASRLLVFLTEDDRVAGRSAAETLLGRAGAACAGATLWRGVAGFGRHRHLRSVLHPDLARGAPLVLEVIDEEASITAFLPVVSELAPGALVTVSPVRLRRSRAAAP